MEGLSTAELGAMAEGVAVKHLKRKGYRILERNLKLRSGEIDVLARKGGVLVIVEVKAMRKESDFGPPVLRVDARKRRKLRQLAKGLMQKHKLRETDIRFDVVCVDFSQTEPIVEVIENAFELLNRLAPPR